MKKCKNCRSSCAGAGKEGNAPNCTFYSTEGSVRITNADRVRKMTDKELAFVLMCPYQTEPDQCNKKNCFTCVLEWLQREVEDD